MALSNGSLLCVRCRKRSPESVDKLCEICGLALHATCSEDAALRDCGLQFGFPGSSAFCSKRCYQAGLLSGVGAIAQTTTVSAASPAPSTGSTSASTSAGGRSRRSAQVPDDVTAALTVKIGEVTRTSRKQLALTSFPFLLSEGFDVFRAKANSCTARELQAFRGDRHVREDMAVYIKPGVHSKQAELVELSERNFESRVARSYRNFLKRKATADRRPEPFQCEIVTYVKKEGSQLHHGRRERRRHQRLSGGDTQSAQQRQIVAGTSAAPASTPLTQFPDYAERPPASSDLSNPPPGVPRFGVVIGAYDGPAVSSTTGSSRSSSSVKRKRSLDTGQDGVSASELLQRQPQHYQPLRGIHQPLQPQHEPTNRESESYRSIRMVLNGSVVSVQVNVHDLLACMAAAQQPPLGSADLGNDEPRRVTEDEDTEAASASASSASATAAASASASAAEDGAPSDALHD